MQSPDFSRDVAEDHRKLPLEVDVPVLALDGDVVARTEERVRGALVHKRLFAQRLGVRVEAGVPFPPPAFRSARLAQPLDVAQVCRGVCPLVGERERRGELREVDLEPARALRRGVRLLVERLEPRRAEVPVVERRLERRRDVVGNGRRFEVARDDAERAVARIVLEGADLHTGAPRKAADCTPRPGTELTRR